MSGAIFLAIWLSEAHGVITRLFIPKGGSGRQHARQDARWLLPFLHLSEMLQRGLPLPQGNLAGSEELWTVPFPSSDASIPESLNLGGGKIRVSSEAGQQGGRSPTSPESRSSGAGRSGGRSRTPAPPDAAPWLRAPGRAPTLPTRQAARRASASQIPAPPGRPPPPPLLLPHGSVSERNFLLGRPLRSPGVWGEGARGRPRRLLLLRSAAGDANPGACPRSEAAAAPAAPGRGDRVPTASRRGEKPSRGPSVREPGAGACSFLAQRWGGGGPGSARAAAPRAGRGPPGRRGGLLRAASGRSQRLALAAAAGDAARPRGAGLRPGPRPLPP